MNKIRQGLRARSERGATMFLIVITILIVVFAGAFAVDLSATANRGQELQNAADSAALAGVQAYRASINSRATDLVPYPTANATDEAAALQAVNDMLAQNGILGVTPVLSYPDPTGNTSLQVELTDGDGGGSLLSGFTGGDDDVSRFATATFKSCSDRCAREVGIPAPFTSVNAKGEGDGYKPIAVGDRFYALNHNKNTITCVDRIEQEACWCVNVVTGGVCDGNTADWERRATRYAYSGSQPPVNASPSNSKWNPEMPHAAVFETTIWWSTSDSSGHHLFCWETQTETPCSISYELNDSPRATGNQIGNTKDQNRGGGTVLVNDKIYVFTDDHMVHCFNPESRVRCAPPVKSSLNNARFPAADPAYDNHGSSIDRIVTQDGKIYSTLHIKTKVPISGPYDCSQNLQDILDKRVIIRVASSPASSSDPWISGDTTNPESSNKTIRTSSDGNDIKDRWDVTDAGNGNYYLTSAVNGRYWDADNNGDRLETSSSPSDDDVWRFVWNETSRTFKIQNVHRSLWVERDGSAYRTVSGESNATSFSVNHWQCEVSPAPPQGLPTLLPYAAGTWLDCFDTMTNAPCAVFTASRVHKDASRFSGRLFFFRNSSGQETGVCSTGFDTSVDDSEFEINCVDMNGTVALSMDDVFNNDFKPAVVASLATYPNAWGDPHYNEQENRLFYPTHHSNSSNRLSRVLCWDFDLANGWCNAYEGRSVTAEGVQYIEDYGFYSEGNCVYALGHRARFWAFKASDLGEACTGSSTEAILQPCNCSGAYDWGTLHFNIDLSPYQSFEITIEDKYGDVIWPKNWNEGDPGHSLFHDGLSIPLEDEPVDPLDPDNDFVVVKVEVENHQGFPVDPNGRGITQFFEVEFEQSPRLTE